MRKHFLKDFTQIYHLDLHGNVRKNPKLSGSTHNVFGIQVGVGITLAIRCKGPKRLRYYRVPEFWRKEEKLAWIAEGKIDWQILSPDEDYTWIPSQNAAAFDEFLSIADIFKVNSLGAGTNRDEWVYDFQKPSLTAKVQKLLTNYAQEMVRFQTEKP